MARQGLVAVEAGLLEDAALLFTTGLQVTPTGQTRFASKLLKDRADCHWGLGRTKEACADVKKALELSPGMKDKPEKWLSRGFDALEQENFPISVQCLSFALVYCPAKNATIRSTAYAWRAEAKYRMGKVAEAQADIASSRKADPSLAKQQGWRNKEQGIQLYQAKSLRKAIVSFGLAKEFTSVSMPETHAQIQSYLASCHFDLGKYKQALEAGKEAYKIRPGRSQDEAKRWKERGKQLFKENRFNLLVDCYSLAICYAPTSDRELLAQLLCNRSLAHTKNNAFTLALLDAERCVKIQPKWSKAHYRLGSSLTGMQRHDDAMVSFASALELADSDEEKYDTLLQILAIGSELEEGTMIIGGELCPRHVIQRAVDETVAKENWDRLALLFLGGGGLHFACYREGGLASDCDGS